VIIAIEVWHASLSASAASNHGERICIEENSGTPAPTSSFA
jgi:hypothetical protein